MRYRLILFSLCLAAVLPVAAADEAAQTSVCTWEASELAINTPLCGLSGDPVRGRQVAADSHAGNCLACHQLPIPEESFQGTVGPPLHGVGARLTPAQLRLRIVDQQLVNPSTLMPPFYRAPDKLNQVDFDFAGQTFLTAQQVEDVVAYLYSLTEPMQP